MDEYFDDLGVAAYLGRQISKGLETSRDAKRIVELYSNTLYEFRLDRDELCVQDMDVLYIGEELQPIKLGGIPLVTKHVRSATINPRGVLYQLASPVDTDNLLQSARAVPGTTVLFEPRAEATAVKLQSTPGAQLLPGQAYAFYITYTLSIASEEPNLFFIGSIQPRDFLDIREKLGVAKAMKRIDLRLWSKRHSFQTAFYDGTAPVMRPPSKTNRKKEGLYAATRSMTYQVSEEWHRSRYFGLFAQWAPKD